MENPSSVKAAQIANLRKRLYLTRAMQVAGIGSLLLLLHVLYAWIMDEAVPGWTTLAAAEFFLGGVELMGIGIVGEYVGRIFEEVKHRPLYIVREHIKHEYKVADAIAHIVKK